MAKLHLQGAHGVERDEALSVQLLERAARQGHLAAQYDFAQCYLQGVGVEKDEVLAAQWFELAADKGFAEAQFMIGNCYKYGTGVGKDAVKANKWFSLAALQSHLFSIA